MSEENPTFFEVAVSLDNDSIYGAESAELLERALRDDTNMVEVPSLLGNLWLPENRGFLMRCLHQGTRHAVNIRSDGYPATEDDPIIEEPPRPDRSAELERTRLDRIERSREGHERHERSYEEECEDSLQRRFSIYRNRSVFGGTREWEANIPQFEESMSVYRSRFINPMTQTVREHMASIALMREKGCTDEDIFGDHCASVADMLRWEELILTMEVVM